LQSNVQVAHEFEITKQAIDDQRRITLGQHGVFRIADESLDLQVLLDEAEESEISFLFSELWLTHYNRFLEFSDFF
jgi:hypothetical protein